MAGRHFEEWQVGDRVSHALTRTVTETDNLLISAALMPLAIASNFLGFWLVQRIPTGPFYRITYALMFLISAALLAQGVMGLLRSGAIFGA